MEAAAAAAAPDTAVAAVAPVAAVAAVAAAAPVAAVAAPVLFEDGEDYHKVREQLHVYLLFPSTF